MRFDLVDDFKRRALVGRVLAIGGDGLEFIIALLDVGSLDRPAPLAVRTIGEEPEDVVESSRPG